MVSTRGYEPTTGRLNSITTGTSLQPIQEMVYEYYADGSTFVRRDDRSGLRERFDYDDLGRLITWKRALADDQPDPQGWGVTWDYDDRGNLKSRTVQTGMTVNQAINQHYNGGAAAPHRLDDSDLWPGKTFTYDPLGNVKSHPGIGTIDYTAFNLPRTVTSSSGLTTDYLYDASGTRVRKGVGGSGGDSTTYVGGLYERRTAGSDITHVLYVQIEGRVVTQITRSEPGGTEDRSYVYSDHLKSTHVIQASNGSLTERHQDPFGNPVVLSGASLDPRISAAAPGASGTSDVTTGFTGQEEERDLGVVNMGGRIYDPRLARFLQADPFVSAPESSQGWNRYSYGLNSPMRYTDPTGFVTQQEAADHELTLDQFCAIYATACSDDLDQNQGFVYEGIAEEGTHTALEGPLPGQFITPFGVQDVLMHQQDEQNLVRWHEEDQAALITVELPHLNVHFVDANGHATMPGLQASLVADAEKRWSGQIGKYYVENTNFHDPDGKDVYFTVRSRRGRSSADTGGDAGDLFIQNENGPRKPGELQSAFAHEVGHILGAKDQYDQATNQIYSGHEHDLMGDSRIPGVRALESTIEEIMKFNGIPIVQ